jgi:tripartite-type tricarboxylate transporter receptor subunit TctC
MSETLKQQVVVENRPGAGSTTAAEFVARSPQDGYTLFMGQVATVTMAITNPNVRLNFAKDFAPITLLASDPLILAVHPSLGVSSAKDLITLAKSKPGELTYASVGPGTINHLLPELISLRTNIKLMHIPYKGSPPAATDLIAGRVSMMMGPASVLMPHVAAGRLKALASASAQRLRNAPDLPTMAEDVLPDFEASIWAGLLAPAGTPGAVIETLSNNANAALKSEQVVSTLNTLGFDPIGGSPEDFARFIAREIDKWSAAAKAAGLKE